MHNKTNKRNFNQQKRLPKHEPFFALAYKCTSASVCDIRQKTCKHQCGQRKIKKNNEHTEIENVVLKEMICNSFLPCL